MAVESKKSLRTAEDYLEALARQGDHEAFDRVLAKVPAVPPAEAKPGNGSRS